jgi:hypothetical protein
MEATLSQFNILICDDQAEHLKAYEEVLEKSSRLEGKIKEFHYARGFTSDLGNYDSVQKIVFQCQKYEENIDIAVIDVNFSELEGHEEISNDGFGYEDLGVKICHYIQANFNTRPLDIIFVSANPGYVKKTYGYNKTPNIHFINKQSDFEKLVEEKIIELLKTRIPIVELRKSLDYIFQLQNINPNTLELSIENPRIFGPNGILRLNINLTEEPFYTFIGLLLASCYDNENHDIEKKPKTVSAGAIAEEVMALLSRRNRSEKIIRLPLHFRKLIFNKVCGEENIPSCKFEIKKANDLNYGFNEKCKLTCKSFYDTAKGLIICPMTLSYSEEKGPLKDINPEDITKKISNLRKEIKEQISKILKSADFPGDFLWNDGSTLAKECKCRADNQEDIENCRFPFCVYSFICSVRVNNYKNYYLAVKPMEEAIHNILEIN